MEDVELTRGRAAATRETVAARRPVVSMNPAKNIRSTGKEDSVVPRQLPAYETLSFIDHEFIARDMKTRSLMSRAWWSMWWAS
jgi:hypothetical protein